ncbi:unnamed protein product [Ranitomeya imitator]|uniref:Septin-type G domain-containing protein n=1 Tax=Ranitomeya imitator TaxID=111125 RepID=A0ABN9MM56_9NEOB|nr:unnamed protein product [Ranitomeya imitator]
MSPGPDGASSRMEELSLVRPAEDAKMCEDLGREPFGYVGIDSVLDQMKRKAMKYGFEFNIMVVDKYSSLCFSWDPIIKYIHEQYEKYLREEISGLTEKRRIPDSRFTAASTFIPPTGHWLRPLDLEFMKRLGRIVNVVPVIAKADTLTLEEREEFKQRIRKDLQTHGISVYPQPELDEDPTETLINDKILRQKNPFRRRWDGRGTSRKRQEDPGTEDQVGHHRG